MKNDENQFQIGKVAKACSISRKMLLDYEKKGLLKPSFVNEMSGYRYFDVDTISKIQLIISLKSSEMKLSEIAKYLNGEISIDKEIKKLENKRASIDKAISELRRRETDELQQIERLVLQQSYCICNEYNAIDIADATKAFAKSYSMCIERGLQLDKSGNCFCEFPENIMSDIFFKTENINMKICIAVENGEDINDAVFYPQTNAVSVSHCGDFSETEKAYIKLREYISEHKLKVIGYPREFYLEGNFSGNAPRYITQIVVPIETD